MANKNVVILSGDNFESKVLNSDVPVMIDFWAEWCGPCQMVIPIVDELANDFEGKATISKLNVDENRELAMKFRVMSIPTILFFKNGQEVERIVGARSKEEYANIINSLL